MFDVKEDECSSKGKKKERTENNVHTNRTSHYGNNQEKKKPSNIINKYW